MNKRITLLAPTALLLLTGCTDRLIFLDSTDFDLAIALNEASKSPVYVNVGFDRSVTAMVPPTETDGDKLYTEAKNDAINLFSKLELSYNNSDSMSTTPKPCSEIFTLTKCTLTLKNTFLSGQAAKNFIDKSK